MNFTNRLTVLIFLCVFGSYAMASEEICFLGDGGAPVVQISEGPGSNIQPFETLDFMAAAPQCKDLKPYITGLDASAYIFYVASAGLACSGVGAPASIGFVVAGVTVQSLNFIVKNLPCEPDIPEEIIERRVEQKVCELLRESGFNCGGSKIQDRK